MTRYISSIVFAALMMWVPFDVSALQEPITIAIVGDIMLDRNVRKAYAALPDPADAVDSSLAGFIQSADIAVANLEGTVTPYKSRVSPKNLQFTFDPKTAALFKNLGFDVVSLANNHALDFGADGYRKTKEFLDEAQIGFFGNPNNDPNAVLEMKVKGWSIAFVGYHDVFGARNPKPTEKVIRTMKKRNDVVIVYPHWGDEYKFFPNVRQGELAHRFINAGADMVIGSHPHVVQTTEIYKGKLIVYSLGNFIFDQKFSKETMRGLALRLRLTPGELEVRSFPTLIHDDLTVHSSRVLEDFVEIRLKRPL